MAKTSKKDAAPAGSAQGEDVATVELSAPAGWKKLLTPKRTGTPLKNDVFFITPTGEEIKTKTHLASYLKSHPGGPHISEFDWTTGDTPRRSSRLSEKQKAAESPETTPVRRKRSGGKKAKEEEDEARLSEKRKESESPETAPGGRKRSAGRKAKEEDEAPETEPLKKKTRKLELEDEAEEGIEVIESDEVKAKGEETKTSEAELPKVDVGEHAKEDVAMETEKTEVDVDEEMKEEKEMERVVEEVKSVSEETEEMKMSNEVEMENVVEEELPGEQVVAPSADLTMEAAEKVEPVEVEVTVETTEQTKTTLQVEDADFGGEASKPQTLEPIAEEFQQHVENVEQAELVTEERGDIKVTIEESEHVEPVPDKAEKVGEIENTKAEIKQGGDETEFSIEEVEKPETNTDLGYKEKVNEREITEDKSEAVQQELQEEDKVPSEAVDRSFLDEKAEEQCYDMSNPTEEAFVEADLSFSDFKPAENEIPLHDVTHTETVNGGQPGEEDFAKDIAELEGPTLKLISEVVEAPAKEEIKVMESGFFEGKHVREGEGEVPYRSSSPVGLSDGEKTKTNHVGGSSYEEAVRRDAD